MTARRGQDGIRVRRRGAAGIGEDAEGGRREWEYNGDGTLHTSIDENRAETVYSYNGNKLLEAVTDALGNRAQVTSRLGTRSV